MDYSRPFSQKNRFGTTGFDATRYGLPHVIAEEHSNAYHDSFGSYSSSRNAFSTSANGLDPRDSSDLGSGWGGADLISTIGLALLVPTVLYALWKSDTSSTPPTPEEKEPSIVFAKKHNATAFEERIAQNATAQTAEPKPQAAKANPEVSLLSPSTWSFKATVLALGEIAFEYQKMREAEERHKRNAAFESQSWERRNAWRTSANATRESFTFRHTSPPTPGTSSEKNAQPQQGKKSPGTESSRADEQQRKNREEKEQSDKARKEREAKAKRQQEQQQQQKREQEQRRQREQRTRKSSEIEIPNYCDDMFADAGTAKGYWRSSAAKKNRELSLKQLTKTMRKRSLHYHPDRKGTTEKYQKFQQCYDLFQKEIKRQSFF